MASIVKFLDQKLRLHVNQDKSAVAPIQERSFLGYRLSPGGQLGLAPKSLHQMKARLRKITRRNRGISLVRMISDLNVFLIGWVTYFRMVRCKWELIFLEKWLRRQSKPQFLVMAAFRRRLC